MAHRNAVEIARCVLQPPGRPGDRWRRRTIPAPWLPVNERQKRPNFSVRHNPFRGFHVHDANGFVVRRQRKLKLHRQTAWSLHAVNALLVADVRNPTAFRFSAVVVALNSANFSPMPVSHDVQIPSGNAAPNACPTVFVVLDGSVAPLTMPTISTGTSSQPARASVRIARRGRTCRAGTWDASDSYTCGKSLAVVGKGHKVVFGCRLLRDWKVPHRLRHCNHHAGTKV